MTPRFAKPARAGQRYRHRPGAYGIFWAGDDILLTYQDAPFDEWQLPGGGIDPGENTLAALHREVREETGWRVEVERHIGSYRNYTWMKEYEFHALKLCHIFVGRAVRCLGQPKERGHHAVFLPAREALAHIAAAGDKVMLAKHLRAPYPRRPRR